MQSILTNPMPCRAESDGGLESNRSVTGRRAGKSSAKKITTPSCCDFLKAEFSGSRRGAGRERGHGADAREPRAGKVRKFFTKRGVNSTTAIIAGAISTNSVQPAPAALAKAVTAMAVAKGAAATGSTLTLMKGALKIMAWTKPKRWLLQA